MTTRITSDGPATYVTATPIAARTTANPERPFQEVIAASSSAIVQGAEQAATQLPGGPVIAAALRTSATPGVGTFGSTINPTPEGASSALGASSSLVPGSVAALPGSPGVEGMLSQGVDQNMYFLELQQRISQESQTYTALSNVLKARYDTVKNALGNIR